MVTGLIHIQVDTNLKMCQGMRLSLNERGKTIQCWLFLGVNSMNKQDLIAIKQVNQRLREHIDRAIEESNIRHQLKYNPASSKL